MLVDRLIERQQALGLSDTEFAVRLGVSYPTWHKTRVGTYPIGISVVRGTLASFPDLRDAVIDFLATPPSLIHYPGPEPTEDDLVEASG